jgi:hypothetical protein
MRITAAVMTKTDGKLSKREIALEDVELDAPRADEVLFASRTPECAVPIVAASTASSPTLRRACSATKVRGSSRRSVAMCAHSRQEIA